MSLFGGKKSNSILGIDIGASSLKVVELSFEKKRTQLMTYGYAELPEDVTSGSLYDDPKKTGQLIADVCKQAGCTSAVAMAALPTTNVFSSILSVPETEDKKERQAAVDAEVSKLAPLPMNEMILQTTFLDKEPDRDAKHFRALVTGAAKTFVQQYVEMFKAAKLELKAIDTEAFALVRSLIGRDKGAICIVDMGSARTNIIIVEKGIPFVSRSVNIGGDTLTRKLMTQMQVDEAQAERMKRDLSTGAQTGEMPKVLEAIMLPIINELRYALELYAKMELTQMKTVEKIILTGGSSHLPHMTDYIANKLNINVYRGDPWGRVAYPADLTSVLEEIGPRFSVAIGLAMKEEN